MTTKEQKPYNFGEIKEYFERISAEPLKRSEIVIVGDRLLTDIYMGNESRIQSILVRKLEDSTVEKHGLSVVALRKFE